MSRFVLLAGVAVIVGAGALAGAYGPSPAEARPHAVAQHHAAPVEQQRHQG